MHGIEAFSLGLRQMHHARRDHPQACLLETAIDIADQIAADAVRLDDGKGALNWHDDLGENKGTGPSRGSTKTAECTGGGAPKQSG